MCLYRVSFYIGCDGNSIEIDENINEDTCINCFSSNTKVIDLNGEVVCNACGCVANNVETNYSSEMMSSLYHHNKDMSSNDSDGSGGGGGGGSRLSGAGNSIITSYDVAMDFSKNGIISGKMSMTDSNNKRVNQNYQKLYYTEKVSMKSVSTNREINRTEGITTILKIIEKLKIPDNIGEEAANIFTMFYPKDKSEKIKYVNITNLLNNKKKLGNDKNVSAKFVAVSCVYFALRKSERISSLIEYVDIIIKNDCIDKNIYTKDIVKKIVNKIYGIMIKDFGLEVCHPDTRNVINQICNSYSIDEGIKRDTIMLYESLSRNISVFQGTASRTIAIVLIYITFVRQKKPPKFLKETKLSTITLKKLYSLYLENLYITNDISPNEYMVLKNDLENGYKIKSFVMTVPP